MERVHIEFKRVQTWLFAVPRLRVMVGANAIIGRVIRHELPQLARTESAWTLAAVTGCFPTADPADPIAAHDDPAADARAGIISRDGGHFEAMFTAGGTEFLKAAAELIRTELPGLPFIASVDDRIQDIPSAHCLTALPTLAPCEWSGHGFASAVIRTGDDRTPVSAEVARRHRAGRSAAKAGGGEAAKGGTATALLDTTSVGALQPPLDFAALASGGYLAVIHADGNGVGSGLPVAEREDARATFFHRNRVLIRRAVTMAIDRTCPVGAEGSSEGGRGTAPVAPLQILMLGGDDLLIACRAELALPLCRAMCDALATIQGDRTGAGPSFRLTLGIGVVIARPTVPFHRLHAVAEALAGSAKRLYRGLDAAERASVIDWAIYTTAWADDPAEVRRRDWIRGTGDDRRLLSHRPMRVLGGALHHLDGLLEGADRLNADEDTPRSQLRFLVEQLARGRHLSMLAYKELSAKARSALDNAGIRGRFAPWTSPAGGPPWVTSVLDLVEVYEIARLGRSARPVQVVDEDEEDLGAGHDGEAEVSNVG
ncbi:MAG: hypothetical protein KF817_03010 [Phycisphaeraceae bacterium]|nr:hypothetical protein [Phycisphaeraceae bacterium]